MSERGVGADEATAIAKTVGSDVEDANENRLVERDCSASGLPVSRGLSRHCPANAGRHLGEGLRHGPWSGKRADSGAAAGEDGPGIPGEDLQTQATCERDQGLEGILVQSGQMQCYCV